nr:hypothetical protein K-LCC10_0237 [Kaumoebavirus]
MDITKTEMISNDIQTIVDGLSRQKRTMVLHDPDGIDFILRALKMFMTNNLSILEIPRLWIELKLYSFPEDETEQIRNDLYDCIDTVRNNINFFLLFPYFANDGKCPKRKQNTKLSDLLFKQINELKCDISSINVSSYQLRKREILQTMLNFAVSGVVE